MSSVVNTACVLLVMLISFVEREPWFLCHRFAATCPLPHPFDNGTLRPAPFYGPMSDLLHLACGSRQSEKRRLFRALCKFVTRGHQRQERRVHHPFWSLRTDSRSHTEEHQRGERHSVLQLVGSTISVIGRPRRISARNDSAHHVM